jgi:hypothetical protein
MIEEGILLPGDDVDERALATSDHRQDRARLSLVLEFALPALPRAIREIARELPTWLMTELRTKVVPASGR